MKFHNGREMTADDVNYSLDRTVNPKTQSPGAGFFSSIKGYDDVAAGKADSAVRRHRRRSLHRRDHADASPTRPSCRSWRSTSPRVVPRKRSRSTAPTSATIRSAPAPSSSTDWTLGQQLVFERNTDYYAPGVPYLDKITFEIGQEPMVALLRLQKGEVDVLGDGIPPAKFLEVMDDPEQKELRRRRRRSCRPATSP